MYTLVSETHDNVDMVLGTKNVYEMKGVINTRDSHVHFLNAPFPIFPKTYMILKPREKRFILIEAPFIDELSGMAT